MFLSTRLLALAHLIALSAKISFTETEAMKRGPMPCLAKDARYSWPVRKMKAMT